MPVPISEAPRRTADEQDSRRPGGPLTTGKGNRLRFGGPLTTGKGDRHRFLAETEPVPFSSLRRGRRGGFTLVELLVTFVLLIIIMYMLATAFTAASTAFNRTRNSVEAHQTVRAAMDILHNDLSGALLVRDQTGAFQSFAGANADPDTLQFTTTTFQTGFDVNQVQVVEIRYFLNGTTLMKAIDRKADADYTTFSAEATEAIAFDVQSIDFRYFERDDLGTTALDPKWTAVWPRPTPPLRLPAAVRVDITVRTVDNTGISRDHTVSQVIYLPNSETQG